MSIDEVRELSNQDLKRELGNTRRELMNLRFKNASKQLDNNAQLGAARKTIARLETVMREREIQDISI